MSSGPSVSTRGDSRRAKARDPPCAVRLQDHPLSCDPSRGAPMRAPILALLLAVLAPLGAAQEAFSDADFGFAIKLPAGLKAMDEQGRASLLGNPQAAKNTSRADAGTEPVQHHYF